MLNLIEKVFTFFRKLFFGLLWLLLATALSVVVIVAGFTVFVFCVPILTWILIAVFFIILVDMFSS